MRLLTIPKAAKDCGLPYHTLLRLVNEKKITAVRLPGRATALLDMADLEAFIAASKIASEVLEDSGNVPQIEERPKRQKMAGTGDKHQWRQEFKARRRAC